MLRRPLQRRRSPTVKVSEQVPVINLVFMNERACKKMQFEQCCDLQIEKRVHDVEKSWTRNHLSKRVEHVVPFQIVNRTFVPPQAAPKSVSNSFGCGDAVVKWYLSRPPTQPDSSHRLSLDFHVVAPYSNS
jgi:hypothetical protein